MILVPIKTPTLNYYSVAYYRIFLINSVFLEMLSKRLSCRTGFAGGPTNRSSPPLMGSGSQGLRLREEGIEGSLNNKILRLLPPFQYPILGSRPSLLNSLFQQRSVRDLILAYNFMDVPLKTYTHPDPGKIFPPGRHLHLRHGQPVEKHPDPVLSRLVLSGFFVRTDISGQA